MRRPDGTDRPKDRGVYTVRILRVPLVKDVARFVDSTENKCVGS